MKKSIISLFAITVVCCMSCSDWLDVKGENQQKETDQFDDYKGFRDALTGCYMTLADEDLYGQKMTMTHVETLANLWYLMSGSDQYVQARYALHCHDYTDDYAQSEIESMYAKLFNVIAQANLIIKHAEEDGGVIPNQKSLATLMGEAYGIRAYCQLDVLRLFGQLPKNGTRQVTLPYSYATGIDKVPAYYNFQDYVTNLESDVEKALSLLKDNDPVFDYTFKELNNPNSEILNDTYMYYRQSRMNYWAVRALQARMYLYLGDEDKAHTIAMELINAKGPDGNPVMELSGLVDFPNCHTCASECLFYVSKYDLKESSNNVLLGAADASTARVSYDKYVITIDMLSQLYTTVGNNGNTASHNRYKNLWGEALLQDNWARKIYKSLKKYTHDDDADDLMIKHQVIPMLRMSEIYLMAMETSSNLEEINSLYATYMENCDVLLFEPFTSIEEARERLLDEYRREFYGEGQMFYTYKRLFVRSMMFNDEEMTEENYIVPLPATEYDPNK